MPIREFLHDRSVDPKSVEIMNTAFLGICADLGLTDTKDQACALVAERVIQMARGYTNPQALRAAVLTSIKIKP